MRTKIYKSKADINYKTFRDFSDVIDGERSDSFIESQTLDYFKPISVDAFALALHTEPNKITMPYRLDFDFKTAGKFIDLDTYLNDNLIIEFLQSALKPKYFFSKKVDINKLSISQVEFIIGSFLVKAQEIKERFEWIYNPPSFGGVSEVTEGAEERQDFAKHYGGYIEMTYLIAGGDVSKIDEITDWSLEKYLFLGEYCLRKRIVEGLK